MPKSRTSAKQRHGRKMTKSQAGKRGGNASAKKRKKRLQPRNRGEEAIPVEVLEHIDALLSD